MNALKYALLIAVPLLVVLLGGCPPPLSPGVVRVQNLVYGQGNVADKSAPGGYKLVDLKYDRIEKDEESDAARPAVVMIHGGSFEGGSKEEEDLVGQADAFALAGYVCFLIDYRLKDDEPPAPDDWSPDAMSSTFDLFEIREVMHASFVDAKTAVRYVRANAASLGVDPERIALWGASAGAFAAIAAGVTDEDAFASDGPEFPVPAGNHPGISTRPDAIIDLWGNAAPVIDSFDPSDPPVMIVHGTRDFTVGLSVAPALEIVEACEENGIPVVYYPIEGAGHGAWEAEVDGKDLAALTLEFLTKHVR